MIKSRLCFIAGVLNQGFGPTTSPVQEHRDKQNKHQEKGGGRETAGKTEGPRQYPLTDMWLPWPFKKIPLLCFNKLCIYFHAVFLFMIDLDMSTSRRALYTWLAVVETINQSSKLTPRNSGSGMIPESSSNGCSHGPLFLGVSFDD